MSAGRHRRKGGLKTVVLEVYWPKLHGENGRRIATRTREREPDLGPLTRRGPWPRGRERLEGRTHRRELATEGDVICAKAETAADSWY